VITNEREDAGLWYAIACGVVLAIAAAIRFRGLGTTLFEDEVWIANLVRQGGWHPHSWSTPPLFYAICRGWIRLRGVSNNALREPAAILGIALCAVPFFAPIPRLSRFAWSVLLAFSSPLLFYAGRTKQYTLEAFAVAVLIVLFLHIRRNDSRIVVVAFFIAGAIAVTTLYSPVFVLVPMAILCVRRPRMLAGFALLAAFFAIAYARWLAPGPESIRLHGDMTAYFAANGRWITSPASFLAGTMHWTGQAMNLVRFWWIGIALLVIAWLIRERDITITLLSILPPFTVAAASTFRLYPYGEVRLMIFCLPALYLLVAESIAGVARRAPAWGPGLRSSPKTKGLTPERTPENQRPDPQTNSPASGPGLRSSAKIKGLTPERTQGLTPERTGAACLLVLAPFVLAGVTGDPYNRTYMRVDDLRPMFDTIARSHRSGEAIYADPSLAAPLRYEIPSVAADVHDEIDQRAARPGWYLQRASTFSISNAEIVMRIGNVTAARIVRSDIGR
jgi:hypothetical protein